MDSRLIWLFALVSLGSWFGTETGYQTHWSYYFLGMNYPLRFVLFGLVLVAACQLLKRQKWFHFFWELTYVIGLLYLFMSLWLLSIFGNLGQHRYVVAHPADQPVLLGHHIFVRGCTVFIIWLALPRYDREGIWHYLFIDLHLHQILRILLGSYQQNVVLRHFRIIVLADRPES